MKFFSVLDFKNGWFIGDFTPSIFRSKDFEIAHHFYEKGFEGQPHIHEIATEVNFVVTGKVKVGNTVLGPRQGFVFSPKEYQKVEFLEDTNLIIVKTPSVPGDKYELHTHN